MRTPGFCIWTLLALFAPMPASQAAVAPANVPVNVPAKKTVYIGTRATGAESRALFSARLVKMNATKLRWYDDASVVRAEITRKALATVRADPDVILVLSEENHPAKAVPGQANSGVQVSGLEGPAPEPETPVAKPAAPLPDSGLASLTPAPSQQTGCGASAPPPLIGQIPQNSGNGGGFGMGAMGAQTGIGAGMGASTGAMGLMDSLAGGVATRLLNRTPSCKISVDKSTGKFAAAGGDGVIEIKASGSCMWQAQTSVPWIKITSGSGVSGSGIVSYSVAQGDGKRRSGAISIVASAGGNPIKGNASLVVTQTK